MLPCNRKGYYAISIIYTLRPKLLTVYKIGPFVASIREVLIDNFHYIDAEVVLSYSVNMVENVNVVV